jgi:hypothetical protein
MSRVKIKTFDGQNNDSFRCFRGTFRVKNVKAKKHFSYFNSRTYDKKLNTLNPHLHERVSEHRDQKYFGGSVILGRRNIGTDPR